MYDHRICYAEPNTSRFQAHRIRDQQAAAAKLRAATEAETAAKWAIVRKSLMSAVRDQADYFKLGKLGTTSVRYINAGFVGLALMNAAFETKLAKIWRVESPRAGGGLWLELTPPVALFLADKE